MLLKSTKLIISVASKWYKMSKWSHSKSMSGQIFPFLTCNTLSPSVYPFSFKRYPSFSPCIHLFYRLSNSTSLNWTIFPMRISESFKWNFKCKHIYLFYYTLVCIWLEAFFTITVLKKCQMINSKRMKHVRCPNQRTKIISYFLLTYQTEVCY